MNSSVLVGGGLLLLAIALYATIPLFSFFWLPKGGRPALYTIATVCGTAALLCGLAILTGMDFIIGRGAWAAVYVLVFTGGLYVFEGALVIEIWRNRRNGK